MTKFWISVKDRLPMADLEAKGETGIIDTFTVHFMHPGDLNEISDVGYAAYLTGTGWCYLDGTPYPDDAPWVITHWSPMPPPPTLKEMAPYLSTQREREVYQEISDRHMARWQQKTEACPKGDSHEWGIDGMHSNVFCKKCFCSKP